MPKINFIIGVTSFLFASSLYASGLDLAVEKMGHGALLSLLLVFPMRAWLFFGSKKNSATKTNVGDIVEFIFWEAFIYCTCLFIFFTQKNHLVAFLYWISLGVFLAGLHYAKRSPNKFPSRRAVGFALSSIAYPLIMQITFQFEPFSWIRS